MKTKVLRRLSAIVCLLLIFNSVGSYASTITLNDDTNASLTAEASSSSSNPNTPQRILGKFYSRYSDKSFYDDVLNDLQYRSNCYGYAFKFFCGDENTIAYWQFPGEFAVKSSSNPIDLHISETQYHLVKDYASLNVLYDKLFLNDSEDNPDNVFVPTTNAWRMSALVALMEADAQALGYTLTEYTGTTIPSATSNTNKRLIAVTISRTDLHFYIQHGDNTWSHKQGMLAPSNQCISCTGENKVELTNSNIRTHACEGAYAGGALKFFYITKNAVVDCKHMNGTAATQTRMYGTDGAGNNMYASVDIGDWPEDYMTGYIDYPGDIDYYSLYTSATENKYLSITSESGYILKMTIYDDSGNQLVTCSTTTNNTSASLTVSVEADSYYYISVEALDFWSYEYNVSYMIS